MESLALLVVVILLAALIGGPTALLLTWIPDRPVWLRVIRTMVVLIFSLISILLCIQLLVGSSIPTVARVIGIVGMGTSLFALLFEFKILKHKANKPVLGAVFGSHLENHVGSSSGGINNIDNGKKIYAVIFASKRQDANSELYYQHNDALAEKVKTIPGYIKHFGIRHPETREGVTVVYFDSIEGIDQWRKDGEHIEAKKLAKSHFYENYSVEITEVIDKYGWDGK